MPVTREQVVAFRAAALHLDRRLPSASLTDAARPVGIQDTPPGNAAVAAAARIEELTPELWTRALEEEKTLVGLWAMRGSSYVVATEDLPVFTAGLLPKDERALLHRITSNFDRVVEEAGVDASDLVDRLADRARKELRGRVLTKRELGKALAPAIPTALRSRLDTSRDAWGDYDIASALALTVARVVAHHGVFVIAPRSGNELAVVPTDEWLDGDQGRSASADARSELVRRFLRAYAPATAADFAWWATEHTSAEARRAHEQDARDAWGRVSDELEEVEYDGVRGFVLGDDAARLASSPEPPGLRLLPPHDPLLMLADRETLVPKEVHKRVWRSQHNPGVVLEGVDVTATWKARKQGRRLVLAVTALAGALRPQTRVVIEAEAQPLAPLRACEAVEVVLE